MLNNRYRLNERTGKIMVVIPAYNEVVAAAKLLDRIADVKI
jgi:hypothetical protein